MLHNSYTWNYTVSSSCDWLIVATRRWMSTKLTSTEIKMLRLLSERLICHPYTFQRHFPIKSGRNRGNVEKPLAQKLAMHFFKAGNEKRKKSFTSLG